MPSTAPPEPPLPPAPAWQPIGRPSPGEAQDWTTWVSPLGRGGVGDALYRALVLADGAIAVTVELHACRGVSEPRTVHRARCGLPPDPQQTAERVRLLLGAADRAAARAVEAHHGSLAGAAAGRTRPSSHGVRGASFGGRPDGGGPAAPHEVEERIREHACRGPATAA